jgi:nitroreductase
MELTEGLKTRQTIRAFLDKDVPRELITELLAEAHQAPSSSNQQPWNFCVVTGEPLATLREKLLQAHSESRTPYDPSKGKTIPAQYVDRTRKLFKGLRPFLQKLGENNRAFIETGSLRLYDAPVAILITIHTSFPRGRLMDLGMAAQNLMLAAHGRGLGTCAIGLALLYDGIIRTELSIAPEFDIALLIALGYPDMNSPVNGFRSPREDLAQMVRWIGGDEKP